ncbi:MAG: adenine-specific methyltransferase EcoRI family protein [Candidatus Gracilibacteria bacterium]|nr:adenine-specific methyltransferase EcoRI family protein [Candidatus Gracilibacteria bacterium]
MPTPPITDKKSSNKNLHNANKAKNDEFYTQLSYIEKELGYYKDHFKDKVIFCNCDDPEESHFWKYFEMNFEHLGIRKLISTHYETEKPSYKLEIIGDRNHDGKINALDIIKTPLKQNGDFRSPECIEILREADIVVTNPPFSLFREYVAQLFEYNKKFIIIGNQNAITYKETFELIKENKIWLGASLDGRNIWFRIPDNYEKFHKIENGIKYAFVASTIWFTNLDYEKRHEYLILYKTYKGNENEYPKYDNYDAINVDKTKDIPIDYMDAMGVPITFLHKYNPDQFEILGITSGRDEFEAIPTKRYINTKQINTDGSVTNGSKANTRATLLLSSKPNGIYYTADNVSGYLSIFYARIIIRNKKL